MCSWLHCILVVPRGLFSCGTQALLQRAGTKVPRPLAWGAQSSAAGAPGKFPATSLLFTVLFIHFIIKLLSHHLSASPPVHAFSPLGPPCCPTEAAPIKGQLVTSFIVEPNEPFSVFPYLDTHLPPTTHPLIQ